MHLFISNFYFEFLGVFNTITAILVGDLVRDLREDVFRRGGENSFFLKISLGLTVK